ncbi:hypothetical protein [Streptosporangium sp. V21-05]|uniref:hypothetical protein n=1 Tax=Streptosporangium sp. V21-05 TaxID=3446115 RepID=UPI003F534739
MNNPNAPILDRTTASGCGCFADLSPPPMGCAVRGHAPAHGCPGRSADHEYVRPTTEPSPALQRAEDLAAILGDVYGIEADVHALASGNAIVSVFLGLLAYTDGETFWWTGPGLGDSGAPLLSSGLTLPLAAERLAGHYRILRSRPAAGVLEGELPLLADALLPDDADDVVPC